MKSIRCPFFHRKYSHNIRILLFEGKSLKWNEKKRYSGNDSVDFYSRAKLTLKEKNEQRNRKKYLNITFKYIL